MTGWTSPVMHNSKEPKYEVAGFCSICRKAVVWRIRPDGGRALLGAYVGMRFADGQVIDPGLLMHIDCRADKTGGRQLPKVARTIIAPLAP